MLTLLSAGLSECMYNVRRYTDLLKHCEGAQFRKSRAYRQDFRDQKQLRASCPFERLYAAGGY